MTNKKGHQTRKQRLATKLSASKVLVDKANAVDDPLDGLDPMKSYVSPSGNRYEFKCMKVGNLSQECLTWVFDLMERNMKTMYQKSNWGWNESAKHKELTETNAWYLIALENEEFIGFSHFRFDLDDNVEVLYCYELQLEIKARRQGLGRFMMKILESLSSNSGMKKVVLTVFKHNSVAKTFFESLSYKLDKTSPPDWENLDYIILSK